MGYKKQIVKSIASLVLLVALVLPTAIQFIHVFECNHEHDALAHEKTTIHEPSSKCDICSFHLTSFDYNLEVYPNLILPEIPFRVNVKVTPLYLRTITVTNTQLRAPPVFS